MFPVETTERGFEIVRYPVDGKGSEVTRLVQQSSRIGSTYEDAMERPGTSFLWLGNDHHLDREEVAHLIENLTNWLASGSLEQTTDKKE